ncbi:hypothetical protein CBR_g8477 [Chara braunii]|uniref:CCHC-type domain-containing protein n=1 Tax=Chara braunii TaxID=69332 RepID=A0A388KMA9_CHABU|nr:hypothetical protein CBR_g8477 [Chara braunii]|eukprot:GBG71175.1 hypothetical protein CBR_g8477 [Chara braunii]
MVAQDKAGEDETATAELADPAAASKDSPEKDDKNLAMWKLLRGPRYFDPQDFMEARCYNCGERGHSSKECTEQKRIRPCYVCSSLEHEARDCPLGKVCFVCQQKGHVARECPNKQAVAAASRAAIVKGGNPDELCLKCGYRGHSRQTCDVDYDPEDMKVVRCYICKKEGHLACVIVRNDNPPAMTCCKCGESGHSGEGCNKLSGKQKASYAATSPQLCYICGEDGHFARGCAKANLCRYCNKEGHIARDCWRFRREDPREGAAGQGGGDGGRDLRDRLSGGRRGESPRRNSTDRGGRDGLREGESPRRNSTDRGGRDGLLPERTPRRNSTDSGVAERAANGGRNDPSPSEHQRAANRGLPSHLLDRMEDGLFMGYAGEGRGWDSINGDMSRMEAGGTANGGSEFSSEFSRKRKAEIESTHQAARRSFMGGDAGGGGWGPPGGFSPPGAMNFGGHVNGVWGRMGSPPMGNNPPLFMNPMGGVNPNRQFMRAVEGAGMQFLGQPAAQWQWQEPLPPGTTAGVSNRQPTAGSVAKQAYDPTLYAHLPSNEISLSPSDDEGEDVKSSTVPLRSASTQDWAATQSYGGRRAETPWSYTSLLNEGLCDDDSNASVNLSFQMSSNSEKVATYTRIINPRPDGDCAEQTIVDLGLRVDGNDRRTRLRQAHVECHGRQLWEECRQTLRQAGTDTITRGVQGLHVDEGEDAAVQEPLNCDNVDGEEDCNSDDLPEIRPLGRKVRSGGASVKKGFIPRNQRNKKMDDDTGGPAGAMTKALEISGRSETRLHS